MDTKWRNYSHSIITKIITFMMVITCFTGVIKSLLNIALLRNNDIKMAFQESYFLSESYMSDTSMILRDLKRFTEEYKSEEYILNGGSISEEEMRNVEAELFYDFQDNSKAYNPNLSEEENYVLFKEVYADKIIKAKEKMIKEELRQYHLLLKR
ncbi:MAG: sensor histidine kinase, partial [Epulopiscium sp.]|nr:sensor histidine kinase [Candidatus Epulonipiscium sp.]